MTVAPTSREAEDRDASAARLEAEYGDEPVEATRRRLVRALATIGAGDHPANDIGNITL